jgi:hypothetical protein
MKHFLEFLLKPLVGILLTLVFTLAAASEASAYCGMMVTRTRPAEFRSTQTADATLFNASSQAIIAHKDDRTTLTMANDFQGAVKDFAMVIPVPVSIKREQVSIGDKNVIARLNAVSQPRLLEKHEDSPCRSNDVSINSTNQSSTQSNGRQSSQSNTISSSGVTIEDKFKVHEYEISILSAKESDGLENWLSTNGYQIPPGASEVLKPYIRQNMKFFVAKINLQEFNSTGQNFLRPLQITYRSPKFVLPIRLGMLNAKGEQDLVAYILSSRGQVEVANYRTVKIPVSNEMPEVIQADFGKFYQAAFQRSYEKENKKVAFLEYAWDVRVCDNCTAGLLTQEELQKAGVFWGDNAFLTRVHVRYARGKFPEDLVFQETGNRDYFQVSYFVRHPYRGNESCDAVTAYRRVVIDRQQREIQNLSDLTGWNLRDIQKSIQTYQAPAAPPAVSESIFDRLDSLERFGIFNRRNRR